MRKTYLDNIRWITVSLVVIYHVIYIFNGVTRYGIIGPFRANQPQDLFQYMVYPWFMLLLFVVSGMSARFELDKVTAKELVRKRTRKLLVPSTIGLLVWGWGMGYYNMLIGGAFEQMGAVPKPILFLIMCVSGTGPLWYIQLLWIFSILLLVIRNVKRKIVLGQQPEMLLFEGIVTVQEIPGEDVSHPQSVAAGLIHIGRADSLEGGANLGLSLGGFTGGIQHPVRRQDEMGALGNEQFPADIHTLGFNGGHFLHQDDGIDDHAVSDDVDRIFAKDSGRDGVKDETITVEHQRMTCIGASLESGHDLVRRREYIHDFSFSLIPPLESEYDV